MSAEGLDFLFKPDDAAQWVTRIHPSAHNEPAFPKDVRAGIVCLLQVTDNIQAHISGISDGNHVSTRCFSR